jgi:zinc protease
LTIATATAAANTDGTIALVLDELERLLADGISARELTEARNYLLGRYRLAMSTPDGQAAMMISARMLGLGDDFIHRHFQALEAVDAAGALETGRRFFDPQHHVLVVVEAPRFSP